MENYPRQKSISILSDKIADLETLVSTLKNYLEKILKTLDDKADSVIEKEDLRIFEEKKKYLESQIMNSPMMIHLLKNTDKSENFLFNEYNKAESFESFIDKVGIKQSEKNFILSIPESKEIFESYKQNRK